MESIIIKSLDLSYLKIPSPVKQNLGKWGLEISLWENKLYSSEKIDLSQIIFLTTIVIYSGTKIETVYWNSPKGGKEIDCRNLDLLQIMPIICRNIPWDPMKKIGFHSLSLERESLYPLQIFLHNPRTRKRINHNLFPVKYPVFIHTPFTLNPAKFSDSLFQDILEKEIRICQRYGYQGIVFHSGKHLNLEDKNQCITNMRNNIRQVISFCLNINETVPSYFPLLLLETPSGQGTELLHECSSMIEFYSSFTEEERKILKITVDTQHVFASGYWPMRYLFDFRAHFPQGNGLIHFNDSREAFGSHIDRHETIGAGLIGYSHLQCVAAFAEINYIPAVRE